MKRNAVIRDVAGTAGLLCLIAGVAMLSVPWALIAGGGTLLGLSIFGALRSDQRTPRS